MEEGAVMRRVSALSPQPDLVTVICTLGAEPPGPALDTVPLVTISSCIFCDMFP
jgi:hypothetical protein